MLAAAVGLLNGASVGGGSYTVDVFFEDGSKSKYARVGDTLEDKDGNQYEITTWAIFPSDFTSGGSMTVSFITQDVTPATSAGFDSSVFTPGQTDVRPEIKTAGTIGSSSIYSGQNYEYTVTAAWDDGAEANKAIVGDNIVDSEGKEFEITFLDVGRFSSPFRVREVVAEGVAPISGPASLYRATANYGLFQGTPISDPARTVVRNRDDFNIDAKLAELEAAGGGGSGSEISSVMPNNSGATILKAAPVRSSAGEATNSIDLSIESHATSIVGVASGDIIDGASGGVVTSGRVTDITTTAGLDDLLWVSKSGTLTNTPPEIGVGGFVAGDFVVMIGVVVKNETDAGKKDLIVHRQIVGQL